MSAGLKISQPLIWVEWSAIFARNMKLQDIKRTLGKTVFHPQWLVLRKNSFYFLEKLAPEKGQLLLDIGCGRGELKEALADGVQYIGFDYPVTGLYRYNARPEVLGTAEMLPFDDGSFDFLVCAEVMEHLAKPGRAAREMSRILRPGGRAVVTIPFAYPIHDAPHDYQRFTRYQLLRIFGQAGLKIDQLQEHGHGLESAALLANLALSKTVLDGIKSKNPVILVLLPLAVIQIPTINLLARLFSWLSGSSGCGFLPMGYELHLSKPKR